VEVVKAGHVLVKKKPEDGLKGRADSFAVKTNVHFPTDISLLFDAIRKVIILTFRLSSKTGVSGWRQSKHNVRKIKRLLRRIQRTKRSTSRNPEKKQERAILIIQYYQAYLELVGTFFLRAEETIREIREQSSEYDRDIVEIESYIKIAKKLMDQIDRRVILGESIKHEEKIFSVFEEHTEWISKGKAGVPVELGLPVCILEDQYQFILHYRVMEKETDNQIAIALIEAAKRKFPDLHSCSFDKGFWSPLNRQRLEEILEKVVLPKKGRLSVKDRERQEDEGFIKRRKQHSAVESAINALDNHGLDRCPDHGRNGFKRYVALGVLARNLQNLGRIILAREKKSWRRRRKLRPAA
jgi:hypothetical protein